jgi:hypothetical protein
MLTLVANSLIKIINFYMPSARASAGKAAAGKQTVSCIDSSRQPSYSKAKCKLRKKAKEAPQVMTHNAPPPPPHTHSLCHLRFSGTPLTVSWCCQDSVLCSGFVRNAVFVFVKKSFFLFICFFIFTSIV